MKEQFIILADVVISFVLAGFVGYERETKGKPAGLRTNMIIAGAAALMISLARSLVEFYAREMPETKTAIDPVRVIEAIVVGISFIGAGTIWKSETSERVENLTTASTILFSAGVGVCVALKLYVLAIGLVVLVLFVNTIISKLGKATTPKNGGNDSSNGH